jgi:hypothetical protein
MPLVVRFFKKILGPLKAEEGDLRMAFAGTVK